MIQSLNLLFIFFYFDKKSLHLSKRKLELERIERENLKIAQKIYELKPHLQVQDLEQEFVNHKRYSQSIRRLTKKRLPVNQQGKHGHLPPIGSSQSQGNTLDNINATKDEIFSNNELSQNLIIPSSSNGLDENLSSNNQLPNVAQSMDTAIFQSKIKEAALLNKNSNESSMMQLNPKKSQEGSSKKQEKGVNQSQVLQNSGGQSQKASQKEIMKLYQAGRKASPKKIEKKATRLSIDLVNNGSKSLIISNADISGSQIDANQSLLQENKQEQLVQQPVSDLQVKL